MPVPDIDFERIRPYGQPASRSGGFEELASLLIKDGIVEWPDGTKFVRFGNPDGGREGKGDLPNGDVWAWQAKYLFEFHDSAASQVSRSILRVFETEPTLKRYFVSLPLDLPGGDTATRVSAHTRWTNKVEEWKELARQKGIEVDFEFVGKHALVTALTSSRHEGRARYWFTADVLTPDWQGRRLEEVVAKAGRRYTPRLHVEVEAVRALDAVGRIDAYSERWQVELADLRSARRWGWRAPGTLASIFDGDLRRASAILDAADAALGSMIAAVGSLAPLPSIGDALAAAISAVQAIEDLLYEHCLTSDRYFVGDAASLHTNTRNALAALGRAQRMAESPLARAASEKRLVLTGRAGVGKTHLFCDVASRRIANGQPTLILLGQDFDAGSLLTQLARLLQLEGTVENVIALLDAASEASACIGLLMLDALNESVRADRWPDDLRSLSTMMDRFPHVALVVSCRSEFVEPVLGADSFPTVEHRGFAEATDVAVRRFAQEYGLEAPTFPVLNPEFSNGFFLKLTCEALAILGATRFPFGIAGLVTVCDAFLEAVNKRLSEPGRSDYDDHTNLVDRAVRELALHGGGPFARDDVQGITDGILPNRHWSQSLLKGMLSEGVLIEISEDRVAFGYQRLGDVVRATAIASSGLDAIRAWLGEVGDERWRERGVLGALAIITPEQHGTELFELEVDADGMVPADAIDDFLESLLLRAPEYVADNAVRAVGLLLDDDFRASEVWDHLLRLACVPGHPLNAEWLHTHLAALNLAERDATWSTEVVGSVSSNDDTPARRLIEWAWPIDLATREPIPDDVASLATRALGWLLSTADRRVRDRATKALVSIADRAPFGFAQGLAAFRGTNDPYVVERLTAAACGATLRTEVEEHLKAIADGVASLLAEGWPSHLLIRDFAKRVYEAATAQGWDGPDAQPPYGAVWPVPTRSIEEIKALTLPPDYAYSSIWSSVTGMGDFGRYVLQSALRHVVSDDETALTRDAERAIFDRVLELGWTPERFGEIDRGRRGGRDGEVERIGKKYQWIAFYEVLGRIADNLPVMSRNNIPGPYEYPEQLIWRDTDPSVLVRQPPKPSRDRLWIEPVVATFPESIATEFPIDMSGVPDPLDLLAVEDDHGERWVVLVARHNWEQALPPEVIALEAPRLNIWMHLHSYLVPIAEVGDLVEWARGRDWYEAGMPEVVDAHNVLLGAYPDDPEWEAAKGSVEWWEQRAGCPQPAEFWQCAARYAGTGTSRDSSAEEETHGYVPTQRLTEGLSLAKGRDFEWRDRSGAAFRDPSVVARDPSALVMRRDLLSQLGAKGMTLFWTVQAESELHRWDLSPGEDDYRWASASAWYVLDGDRIMQVHTIANSRRSGPTTEAEVGWNTRPGES